MKASGDIFEVGKNTAIKTSFDKRLILFTLTAPKNVHLIPGFNLGPEKM